MRRSKLRRSKSYTFKLKKYHFGYLYLNTIYGIGFSIGLWYFNKKITFDLQILKFRIYILLEKHLRSV